ncbi:MAG: glycosyltransferase [Rhodothermales bacterium]
MNILWIPHSPSEPGVHRRDQYFIQFLKERHHIYTLTWETWYGGERLKAVFAGLKFYPLTIDDLDAFHVRRIPDLFKPFRKKDYERPGINERFFHADIRRIVKDQNIDLVIAGPTSFMTGYPPFDLDVPLIFDYLDCADWVAKPDHPEITYMEKSDAILCVSSIAKERAEKFNKPSLYLPNGADIDKMRNASGEKIREKLGLTDAKVVSLIGLTCSPRLYFLESVLIAKKQIPDLKCLLVGHSPAIEAALAKIPNAEDTFLFTGPVPYAEIASYFAATDVGMYPVDEAVYYDAASPIKIFEYTAAGKPIVVPRITEAERLGFDNLVFASPDADSYAEGIVEAFKQPPTYEPKVEKFDWEYLAESLDKFLMEFDPANVSQTESTSIS